MPDLDALRRKLEDTVSPATFDLDACWQAFEAEAGEASEDAFVQFLWDNGIVDGAQAASLSGKAAPDPGALSAVHVHFGGPSLPSAVTAEPISTDDAAVDATLDAAPPGAAGETLLQEGSVGQLPLPPGLRRHSILAKVGAGGMASVYLARDASLRRRVALKQQDIRDLAELKQFTLEAQVTAQLEHPHIVPVYAFEATTDGRVAYTMKLVEGKTLEEVIEAARDEPQDGLAARLELFLQICAAIDYAHAKGVIHRDLKPANVMIGPFGELYVLDWGLSKLIAEVEPADAPTRPPTREATPASSAPNLEQVDVEDPATRTVAGALKGTPLYMAPEQALAQLDAIGPHSDQFALGLILYELINLRRAYPGKSLKEVLASARKGEVRPPSPDAEPPLELSAIVHKATALDPAERYPSVRELGKDVRRFLRNVETRALPDDLPRKLRRWLSRHPQQALAIGGALVLLVAISVVLGVARQRVAVANARLHAERKAEAQRQLVGLVNERARDLSRDVLWYRGLTEGLARATSVALQHGTPSDETLYTTADFTQTETAPAGMLDSPHYRKPINTRWPVTRLAPSADPARAEDAARRLLPLRHVMRDMFRDRPQHQAVVPRGEVLDARITQHEVPMEWVYVATETGAIVLFPGARDMGWDADYDPRQRSWYREAKLAWEAGHERRFSSPYVDQMGMGLVVTATQACVGDDGEFLGVAALDLGLSYVIETYLRAPELPGFRRGYLLNLEGQVLLSSDTTTESPTRDDGGLMLPAFPHTEQLWRILDERSGLMRAGESALAWARTDLGGIYVAEADVDSLFSEPE